MNLKQKFYNRWAVAILRFVVGAVFIVSGFSKLIDTWGFVFKMEEYLAAMGFSLSRTTVVVGAAALSGFEFVGGLLLLLGAYKRSIPWLFTLMTSGLLVLTFWTWVADPVADCGCFGELITLSNAATFWKNVALMLALVYLSIFNKYLRRGVYEPAIQWVVLATLSFFALCVSMFGYHVQPMLDFRPYPVGTDLAALLSGDGDEDEADEFEFVYSKDGREQTFTIDNLPDSTWQFVDRRPISKPAAVKGFSIYDGGEDVTDVVIAGEGEQLIFVVPESQSVDISYTYGANEFNRAVERDGGQSIGLVAASGDALRRWNDLAMSDYSFYTADDTPLKQLARGSMAVIYLRDGVIQWKRTMASFDFRTIDAIGSGEVKIADLKFDDKGFLIRFSLIIFGALGFLALFQEFIIRIWRKTVTLHKRKLKGAPAKPAPDVDAPQTVENKDNNQI